MIMTFWSDRNMKTLPTLTQPQTFMPFWAFLLMTLCLVPIHRPKAPTKSGKIALLRRWKPTSLMGT